MIYKCFKKVRVNLSKGAEGENYRVKNLLIQSVVLHGVGGGGAGEVRMNP